MVLAEFADSGFFNRSFVGFLLRLVDFRSKLVFGTPHFTHFIFTTPLFGYVYLSCLGVPVICTILYLGGPAGTMHDCTN